MLNNSRHDRPIVSVPGTAFVMYHSFIIFGYFNVSSKRLRGSAASSDGFFQFDVTDGTHTVRDQLMPIKVVYLRLSLAPGAPLHVFPGPLAQCVTIVQLNATTNNAGHSRSIVFNVEHPPTRGRLGKVVFLCFISTNKY